MKLTDDFDALWDRTDLETAVLDPREERRLLIVLGRCKAALSRAVQSASDSAAGADSEELHSLTQSVNALCSRNGAQQVRLAIVFRRYCSVRSRLALANMRLVVHIAKGFRDRGISRSDLVQEGFCGLLEAIDRFDISRETKLATYATWWIRQSIQQVVAGTAYPVRLSPRHLRQLARTHDETGQIPKTPQPGTAKRSDSATPELIQRIRAATRVTSSFDAPNHSSHRAPVLQSFEGLEVVDHATAVDRNETVGRLLNALQPRERQVLCLRFGLEGADTLSLSQAGKILAVSKERIRQIQDKALEKLRAAAAEIGIDVALGLDA